MGTQIARALFGGSLIGTAAFLLFWLNGRICGVSGIIGGTLGARRGDALWRVTFAGGLIAGGAVMAFLFPASANITVTQSLPQLALGGLFVGYGTRLGSGCTSGHGICGVGRFSLRGIVATLLFMMTSFATVYVVRHLIGGAK